MTAPFKLPPKPVTRPAAKAPRQKPGPKPLPVRELMRNTSISMTDAQREKMRRNGGNAWVRSLIDAAKEQKA